MDVKEGKKEDKAGFQVEEKKTTPIGIREVVFWGRVLAFG